MTTTALLGVFGIGLLANNASASDLSRFLEHSRINLTFGGYPQRNYYPAPIPQYIPAYGPQYGNYLPANPYGMPVAPQYGVPQYGVPQAPIPAGYGFGVNDRRFDGDDFGHFDRGDRYCHHGHCEHREF